MIKTLAIFLLSVAPAGAVSVVSPVTMQIPGAQASIAGYVVLGNGGLATVFGTLAGGAPQMTLPSIESSLVPGIQLKSLQKIAHKVSPGGVTVARVGSTLIVMPSKETDDAKAKVAVMSLTGPTYHMTTMRQFGEAYEKTLRASDNPERFNYFEMMFDGKGRRLPGLPSVKRGSIPVGLKTQMRSDKWKAAKRQVEATIDRQHAWP